MVVLTSCIRTSLSVFVPVCRFVSSSVFVALNLSRSRSLSVSVGRFPSFLAFFAPAPKGVVPTGETGAPSERNGGRHPDLGTAVGRGHPSGNNTTVNSSTCNDIPGIYLTTSVRRKSLTRVTKSYLLALRTTQINLEFRISVIFSIASAKASILYEVHTRARMNAAVSTSTNAYTINSSIQKRRTNETEVTKNVRPTFG